MYICISKEDSANCDKFERNFSQLLQQKLSVVYLEFCNINIVLQYNIGIINKVIFKNLALVMGLA